jgi:hypothetical protein
MLGTYIKNRGMTKTIIHSNNKNKTNEIKWDADYDGNVANVSINSNNDGIHDKFHFTLNNEDLANIMNIDTVNMPLEQRLKRDFKKRRSPKIYQIELGNIQSPQFISMTPTYDALSASQPIIEESSSPFIEKESISPIIEEPQSISFEKLLHPVNTHLSSPKSNEEFIIPMTIDEKTLDKLTFTPHKRHRKYRTHKTHRVYKRRKSSISKNNSKSKKNSKKSF